MQSLFDIFHSGGFVMYPLALCSLISWSIALERFWTLKNTMAGTEELTEKVQASLIRGDTAEALEACHKSRVPLARALEDLIQASLKKAVAQDVLAQRANRKRLELQAEYKKYIWALGTIASATPFLGLFGTVVGILRAFHNISVTGDSGFSVVASEISEALIATATGIIVAVIAVALYNFFQVQVGKLVLETRLSLDEFLENWNAARAGK